MKEVKNKILLKRSMRLKEQALLVRHMLKVECPFDFSPSYAIHFSTIVDLLLSMRRDEYSGRYPMAWCLMALLPTNKFARNVMCLKKSILGKFPWFSFLTRGFSQFSFPNSWWTTSLFHCLSFTLFMCLKTSQIWWWKGLTHVYCLSLICEKKLNKIWELHAMPYVLPR